MSGLFNVLVIGSGFLFVLAALAGLAFYLHPLAINRFFERRALSRAGGLRARDITVSTGKLVLWEGGNGPAVLLLHGAGDHAGTWSKVVPQLKEKHRVLIPDLPGHGESEPLQGELDIEMMFTAVNELLDSVSPGEPVTIAGNSLGAWIAMLVAARQPEKVSCLILVNGGAIRGDYKGPGLIPRNLEEARQLMSVLMGEKGERVPNFILKDLIRESHSGPLMRLMANPSKMGASLLEGKLGGLRQPVALLWGGLDRMFDLSYAKRLADELPEARIEVLENCGHVPQRQCPGAFTSALLRILEDFSGD